MRNITWKKDHPDAQYSSTTGTDQDGNKFWMNACQEVCGCELKDGRTGQAWTAEQAYANALADDVDPLPAERAKVKRLREALESCWQVTGEAIAGDVSPDKLRAANRAARVALKKTEGQ